MNKIIFLVRGLPGSGKSTLARQLCPIDDVCEADKYFEGPGGYNYVPSLIGKAHAWCKAQVESRMRQGTDRIAVSNTFTQEWELEPYLEMARQYGYTAISVIVENRHGSSNVHGVPDSKVDLMRQRFEVRL
jgi:predicted kinase